MGIKIDLPAFIIDKLANLPEQGMGYQVVNIKLKGGILLTNRKVINSTYLLVTENETITTDDIEEVELAI